MAMLHEMPTGNITSRDDKGQYKQAEHAQSSAGEAAEWARCSLLLLVSALTDMKFPLLSSGLSPGA